MPVNFDLADDESDSPDDFTPAARTSFEPASAPSYAGVDYALAQRKPKRLPKFDTPDFDPRRAAEEYLAPDASEEHAKAQFYAERGFDPVVDAVGRVVPRGTKFSPDGRADLEHLGELDAGVNETPTVRAQMRLQQLQARNDAIAAREQKRQDAINERLRQQTADAPRVMAERAHAEAGHANAEEAKHRIALARFDKSPDGKELKSLVADNPDDASYLNQTAPGGGAAFGDTSEPRTPVEVPIEVQDRMARVDALRQTRDRLAKAHQEAAGKATAAQMRAQALADERDGVVRQPEPAPPDLEASTRPDVHLAEIPETDAEGRQTVDSLVRMKNKATELQATLDGAGGNLAAPVRARLKAQISALNSASTQGVNDQTDEGRKAVSDQTRAPSMFDVASGAVKSLADSAAQGGSAVLKGAQLVSDALPSPARDEFGVRDPQATAENARRATLTPSQKLDETLSSPAYQLGSLISDSASEFYAKSKHEDAGTISKGINAAAEAAGGFAPLLASGPLAPVTMGLQTAGNDVENIYRKMVARGTTPDGAADFAVKRALASGAVQAAIFEFLPKPLAGAVNKGIADRIAKGALTKFLTNRLAQGAEGAVLGAGSKLAANATTGESLTEGVTESAAGLALAQGVMPRGALPAKADGEVPPAPEAPPETPNESTAPIEPTPPTVPLAPMPPAIDKPARITEMLAQGHTPAEVAAEVGVPLADVHAVRESSGIPSADDPAALEAWKLANEDSASRNEPNAAGAKENDQGAGRLTDSAQPKENASDVATAPVAEEVAQNGEVAPTQLQSPPEAVESDVTPTEVPTAEAAAAPVSTKPAYRNPPGDAHPESPRGMSYEHHTLPENLIESAKITAGAYDQPVYIGGKPETVSLSGNATLAEKPTVQRNKPTYVAATIHPDGRVEIEDGWYRTNPNDATPSEAPQPTPTTTPPKVTPESATVTMLKGMGLKFDAQGKLIPKAPTAEPVAIGDRGTPEEQAAKPAEPAAEVPTPVEMPPAPPVAESATTPETPAPEEGTGIKNASVAEMRKELGLPEADERHGMKTAEAHAQALAIVKADPQAGARLADELERTGRAATGIEDLVLAHELTRIRNERSAAETEFDAATQSSDPVAIEAAQTRINDARDAFNKVGAVADATGTAQSDALRLRGAMLKEDFSIANLERRLSRAKGNEPLTAEDTALAKKFHEDYEKTLKEKDAAIASRDLKIAEQDTDLALFKIANRVSQERKNPPKSWKPVHDTLIERGEAAKQRLIAKRNAPPATQFSTGGQSDVDSMAPKTFSFRDVNAGELPGSVHDALAEGERGINQVRALDGKRPIKLVPVEIMDVAGLTSGLHAGEIHGGAEDGIGERPGDSGAARPDSGEAQARGATLRRQLELVFKKRITFFRASEPVGQDALTSPNRANQIFINADSPSPLLSLTGHEFTHNLKQQAPHLYRELTKFIDENNPILERYKNDKRAQHYGEHQLHDEWVADMVGERFTEPEFWKEAAKVAEARGQMPAFKRLAKAALDWIDNVIRRVRNAMHDAVAPHNVDELQAIRTKIAEVFHDYAHSGPYPDDPNLSRGVTDASMVEPLGRGPNKAESATIKMLKGMGVKFDENNKMLPPKDDPEFRAKLRGLDSQVEQREAELRDIGEGREALKNLGLPQGKTQFSTRSEKLSDEDSKDYAQVVAGHLANGLTDPAKLRARLTKDFGDEITPHIPKIVKAGIEEHANSLRAMGTTGRDTMSERESTVAAMKARVAAGESISDLTPFVQRIAEQHLREGVKFRQGLWQAVHRTLREVDPNITPLETLHALSGYGKQSKLNPEAVKAQLRDLRAQLQKVAQVQDLIAKKAPLKTGMERGEPSDEVRRLQQQVKELQRKGGYAVTDPASQLRAPLDEVKKRLTNQIKDLDFQISTGKKIVREKTAMPADAETASLTQQRDALRKRFDEIFTRPELTREQRIARADKYLEGQINNLGAQLRTGTVFAGGKPEQISTPALDAKRAQINALKEQREYMRMSLQPSADPLTGDALRLQALKTRLAEHTAELQDKIAKGNFAKSAPRPPLDLDAEAQKLTAAHERVKQDFENKRFEVEQAQRPRWEKVLEQVSGGARASALSGYHTLIKLAAYSATKFAGIPVTELTATALSKVPGLRRTFAMSPHEGGATADTLGTLYHSAATKGLTEAARVMRTGKTDAKAVYGKQKPEAQHWYDFPGKLHGAEKAPLITGVHAMLVKKATAKAKAAGVDVTDELVKGAINKEAWDYSNRSILQENNKFSNWINDGLAKMRAVDKETGKASGTKAVIATALETLLTKGIVKTPANYFMQSLEASPIGFATGVAKQAVALRRGVQNLTPKEADTIARLLSVGAVGSGLFVLGVIDATKKEKDRMFGGYYQPGDKRGPTDASFGSIRIGDTHLPHLVTHNPFTESAQMGSTFMRVMLSKLKKSDVENRGALAGALSSILGLAEGAPIENQMLRLNKLTDPHQQVNVVGGIVRGLVPQLVANIAEDTDSKKRAPTTVGENVEMAVPGLRQQVPVAKPKK